MTAQPTSSSQHQPESFYTSPARMLTYAQAAELLAVAPRTVRRRVANGQYLTYGEGPGKRVLYHSIMADIRRACGEAP
jgi:hypothetical protein